MSVAVSFHRSAGYGGSVTSDRPGEPYPEDAEDNERAHDSDGMDDGDLVDGHLVDGDFSDADFDDDETDDRLPLSPDERQDIVGDLEDLEVYRTLLEPTGIKGIVIDCPDCETMHHIGWALMQSNLRQLLDEGVTGLHEPPYDPDPAEYVTWEYARGYTDGIVAAESTLD